jgi:hypothetical protein
MVSTDALLLGEQLPACRWRYCKKCPPQAGICSFAVGQPFSRTTPLGAKPFISMGVKLYFAPVDSIKRSAYALGSKAIPAKAAQ